MNVHLWALIWSMLIYHPLIGGTVQWAMIGQTVKWVIIGRMRAWIFNGMTSQQLWHVGVALPPQAPLRILTGLRPPKLALPTPTPPPSSGESGGGDGDGRISPEHPA